MEPVRAHGADGHFTDDFAARAGVMFDDGGFTVLTDFLVIAARVNLHPCTRDPAVCFSTWWYRSVAVFALVHCPFSQFRVYMLGRLNSGMVCVYLTCCGNRKTTDLLWFCGLWRLCDKQEHIKPRDGLRSGVFDVVLAYLHQVRGSSLCLLTGILRFAVDR